METEVGYNTSMFTITSREHTNYRRLVSAMWPHLKWRHAGFGALQAYVMEGEREELRVHLWHPSLVKKGIAESGLCHDHRFDMRSIVLVGNILQTEFHLIPNKDGAYQAHLVTHAREAMAEVGSFHKDPTLVLGESYDRFGKEFRIPERAGYTFRKFLFHESQADGVTITLVEKKDQAQANARILAPKGKPIIHAFTETWHTLEQQKEVLEEGLAALRVE